MNDPIRILESATNILLVDWPNTGVPRALVEAGFTVFCYSPDKYSTAEIAEDEPRDVDEQNVFAPENDDVMGFLVLRPFEGRPESVDIVSIYRPPEEVLEIIESHVLPLGATALWLQPPVTSIDGRRIAAEHGLDFLEGVDIAETARQLKG